MILSLKNTEEWVRWTSQMEMFMLEIPDRVFDTIAHETGTVVLEIGGTAHLEDKRVAALVSAVQAEQESGFASGRLFLDGAAQALAAAITQVSGVLRRPLRMYRGGLAPQQLRRVTEYINGQLDQNISAVELAEQAGLSTAHFSQMFRRSTGMAPHQFVLRARIERAKKMLVQKKMRVIDVALACGFQTPQHFAKVFQRFCDATPTQYRAESIGLGNS